MSSIAELVEMAKMLNLEGEALSKWVTDRERDLRQEKRERGNVRGKKRNVKLN